MMYNVFIYLGLVVAYFLKDINFLSLQFPFLGVGNIYPDFLLLYIVFFALITSDIQSIWIAFAGGLLEDTTLLKFSSQTSEFTNLLGIHALVYPVVAYVLTSIKKHIDIDNMITIITVSFFSVLVSRILVWLYLGIVDNFYSMDFLGPSLYSAVLAPVWFSFLRWVFKV